MRKANRLKLLAWRGAIGVSLIGSVAVMGCGTRAPGDSPSAYSQSHGPGHHHSHGAEHARGSHAGHGHSHGSTGPHGGHLIELGRDHAYHAELVEETESRSVAVHLLDSRMRELPIEHSTIVLVLIADGISKSYELYGDTTVSSERWSTFRSLDTALFEALARGAALTAKLRVTIAGVPYVGQLAHEEHGQEHAAIPVNSRR